MLFFSTVCFGHIDVFVFLSTPPTVGVGVALVEDLFATFTFMPLLAEYPVTG